MPTRCHRAVLRPFLCTSLLAATLAGFGRLARGETPAEPLEEGQEPAPAVETAGSAGTGSTLAQRVYLRLQGAVDRADRFLGGENGEALEAPRRSRASVSVDARIEEGGPQVNADVDVSLDIKLPRTRERLGLFLNTSHPEELPLEDPEETENSLFAGLHHILAPRRLPHVDTGVGVKVRDPPELFARIEVARRFAFGKWDIAPSQRGFWLSDDGFGEVTTLRADYWFRERVLARSLSVGRWTERSRGFEWEQMVLVGYTTGRATYRGVDRGLALAGTVYGHKSGEGVVDQYRLALIYRKALFCRWLYLRTGPEVDWHNEDDWNPAYSFRIGLDALFWSAEDLQK